MSRGKGSGGGWGLVGGLLGLAAVLGLVLRKGSASAPLPAGAARSWGWPLSTVVLGSRYGVVRQGIDRVGHPGQDFSCPTGTPVYAVAAGTVVTSRTSPNDPPDWKPGDPAPRVMGFGNIVVIDHGKGLSSWYAHLSQRDVAVGQSIARGHRLGLSGSTGYSFGPHLHLEARVAVAGKYLTTEPLALFPASTRDGLPGLTSIA